MPHYMNLVNRFSSLQLDHALSLNSIYAKRIYEMLCMYKNFENKKFTISVNELKERLGVIFKNKDKYKNFAQFLKNVIVPAENEINGNTDVFFTYKLIEGKKIGKGRKPIEKIQFGIIYDNREVTDTYVGDKIKVYNRLIEFCKLRKVQAIEALSLHSVVLLNAKIYEIEIKYINKVIQSIGAYTVALLGLKAGKVK